MASYLAGKTVKISSAEKAIFVGEDKNPMVGWHGWARNEKTGLFVEALVDGGGFGCTHDNKASAVRAANTIYRRING